MTHKLLLAALTIALPTGALASDQPASRTTGKPVEQFAHCFAAHQQAASRPWSFVPREGGGGTFSDAGARGVRQPYFLRISDQGSTRELRLEAAGADTNARRAMERCA